MTRLPWRAWYSPPQKPRVLILTRSFAQLGAPVKARPAAGHERGFVASVYLHSGVVRAAGSQLRKPVTCSAHGLDEMWVLGVGLYLRADVLDVHVRSTGLAVEVVGPDLQSYHDARLVVAGGDHDHRHVAQGAVR